MRKQVFDPCERPSIAVAPGEPYTTRFEHRFEQRSTLCGRRPVPCDAFVEASVEIRCRKWPLSKAIENVRDVVSMGLPDALCVAFFGLFPGDSVIGDIAYWQDVQRLVVRLEEPSLIGRAVQPIVAPRSPVTRDASVQHEVVVPPSRCLERVELERSQPVDHREHRACFGRQRARREQPVSCHQEPTSPRCRQGQRLCDTGGSSHARG